LPLTTLLAALVAILGCGSPVSTPTRPDSTTVWDVIYMNRQPVGHQSLTLRSLTVRDQLLHDAEATTVLNVQRFGQSTRETMQLASRESPDGQVVSIEATMQSGNGVIRILGRRTGNELRLQTHAGGQVQSWALSLPPHCGGYFAVEWSLRANPMRPGEQRQLQAVLPVLNQIAQIRLTAGEHETVELLDETRNLLRIDQQLHLPDGNRIDVVAWTTEDGEVLKSEVASLQQVTYRVEREQALASTEQARFDLGKFSTVRLAEPLLVTNATRQIRYLVTLNGDDPTKFFLNRPDQLVVSRDGRSAEVTVQSLRPGQDRPAGAEDQVQDADREPSTMIQSDDRLVRDLAARIQASGSDAWSKAVATERFVFENLTAKNLSTAFATAAEVAKSREGDCTEHAVLTAALCRAQAIPARVLIGLVYAPEQQGFAFHMWNEVWVEDGWFPLDATVGRGGTGPTYLIVGRSNLATGDAFSALLPVMKVMGQLSIQVLEVVNGPGQPEKATTLQ
jgi:transglutaminase-like putative cysteine protease